jgi:hypothetical protein
MEMVLNIDKFPTKLWFRGHGNGMASSTSWQFKKKGDA